MQTTKDTFYVALRDRLVQFDPQLTITIDGATRPAIVVVENEPPSSLERQNDAFYIEWGMARAVHTASSTLMAMDCTISYTSAGDVNTGGVGRGRDLGRLDTDLLAICAPAQAYKCDYSSGPPTQLGSYIFWSIPEVTTVKTEAARTGHEAHITIWFYPEVNQA